MTDLTILSTGSVYFIVMCVGVLLCLIEIFMTFVGGLSTVLDDFGPDIDGDIEPSPAILALNFLGIGRVPFTIWLVTLLTSFSVLGIYITLKFDLSQVITIGPVLIVALVITKFVSQLFSKIIPGDETTAVSEETLVGLSGVLMSPSIKPGYRGQLRVIDIHNQVHYIMVEPNDDVEYIASDILIVTERRESYFKVSK